MLIKQVEVTLAVYYRRTDEEGKSIRRTHLLRGISDLGGSAIGGKEMASAGFCVRSRHLLPFYQHTSFTTSEVLAQSF